MQTVRTFTFLDALLIAGVALAGVASLPLLSAHSPDTVCIYRDNTQIAELPLSRNAIKTIHGYEGPMRIRIHDNAVHVQASSCRRQICVHAEPIRTPAQQIICAPNHILITVKASDDTLDAISR